jgi:gluconolactonase
VAGHGAGTEDHRVSRIARHGIAALLAAGAVVCPAAPAPPTVEPGATLETVFADPRFFEGPTWDFNSQRLYFTAFGKERADTQILRLEKAGKATVFMDRTEGVNGTFLSRDGELLGAQAFGHRVLSLGIGTNGPSTNRVLLFDTALNQPNDLCAAADGTVYFTDPNFDSYKSTVRRFKPGGPVETLITDLPIPNGLELSPDGRRLVVGDSLLLRWFSWDIGPGGGLTNKQIFFDPGGTNDAPPDGMCADELGNFYLTGRGGVWVTDPDGRQLGFIPVPEFVSNVCFGDADAQSLYLTCQDKVYRLRMRVRGAGVKPFIRWNQPDGRRHALLEHHAYRSAAMNTDVGYTIWLPPQYALEPESRFPVLYWLHGLGGSENGGRYPVESFAHAITNRVLTPFILIQPNGGAMSVYADSQDGRWLAETTLIRELIPHIDATYRTATNRESRAIHGMSMGGEGALRFALKYPGLFGSVIAYAGGFVTPQELAEGRPGIFELMFGNDPAAYELSRVPRHIGSGTGQPSPAIRIVCGTADTESLPLSRDVSRRLREAGIRHSHVEVPGAGHDVSELVNVTGPDDLSFIAQHLRRP